MSQSAICYVSDVGFLIPTLISVRSLRRFVPPSVPVFLVTILDDDAILDPVRPVLDELAITVISLPRHRLDTIAADWADSHVPVAALGRFFLHDLLPADVTRILYIDGDTLVLRDLTLLLSMPIPAGKIGMVEDSLSFYRHDQSRNGASARDYLAGLSLSSNARYANSGVFIANREDWRSISADALNYLRRASSTCLYHDQSAINAILGERSFALSPRWNYQSRFLQWRSRPVVEPAIVHFTGAAKPWMGKVRPWERMAGQVSAILSDLPVATLPLRTMSARDIADHNAQYQGAVQLVRRALDLRQRRRVTALRRYHDQSVV